MGEKEERKQGNTEEEEKREREKSPKIYKFSKVTDIREHLNCFILLVIITCL